MKAVQLIKLLMANASNIRDLFKRKIPLWEADSHRHDKTGWGFNKDSRFRSCESISISFDSWMGTYGDSGCSSQLSLDKDIFAKALVSYLNKNKETIMLSIADNIERQAVKLREDAEKELNEQLDRIRSIGEKVEQS